MDGSADALGVVPAHTYARLRFDEAAEQAVQHLGYVLQMHQGSPYQGQFVAQAEQRAGASPRAFPGRDGRDNPRGRRATKHSGEWGCVASGGRTTLERVHSLRSSRPSISPRMTVPSQTSRASRPPFARATRARSRPDLERALTGPTPRAHAIALSYFHRDGVLSPAHRTPLGATGHGDDWTADHGRVEPPGHAIRTGSREAVAAVQVRACPTRRISPRDRSRGKKNFGRCWFSVSLAFRSRRIF